MGVAASARADRKSMRARRVKALRPRYRPNGEAWAKAAVAIIEPATHLRGHKKGGLDVRPPGCRLLFRVFMSS